ncbi:methyl-accepting chemotaxis protein [Pseudomonas sp. WN033]|nr:methyl-accepting chemotaxis protein [Pseudomonas sp. WN033]
MLLRNYSIAARLAAGFAVMAVIVLLLGMLGMREMGQMRQQAEEVDSHWVPGMQLINSFGQSFMRVRIFTLRIMLDEDGSDAARLNTQINEMTRQIDADRQRYAALISYPDEQRLFEQFNRGYESYMAAQREAVDLALNNRFDLAMQHVDRVLNPQADQVTQALLALERYTVEGVGAAADESAASYSSARSMVIVAVILAALLTVLLAWTLTQSIIGPIRQAVQVSETVAQGDLTRSIQVQGRDEPARLLRALASMQEQLRDTIVGISNSSTQLASAAEELNAVTEDATRGLQRQDDEVQQAATAVNEMTTAVEEVASNAASTSDLSQQATRITEEGRQQVGNTLTSIGKLTETIGASADEVQDLAARAQSISQVLDVIRAIAEQTNLLALNAAIEAARAGEAGRGFAVVADEVRALAHRTQQSTSEIEEMISSIQQGSERAVEAMGISRTMSGNTQALADAAGQALRSISEAIGQINERNLVIASAAEEQAQVAREVDRNLVNIRDLSTQSAAGAEQTSSSSRELSRLAVELNDLVTRFKV